MKKLRLSSKVSRTFQGSSRGFALVEILIAIALLGIIAIAFVNGLYSASKVLFIADERTTAESLARMQMEYAKSQGYQAESAISEPIYQKIGGIPDGYAICSVNRDDEIVDDVVGIPWDSFYNEPADTDKGLQKIALVIKCQDEEGEYRVIHTFINDNPNWATGLGITLEEYKVDR